MSATRQLKRRRFGVKLFSNSLAVVLLWGPVCRSAAFAQEAGLAQLRGKVASPTRSPLVGAEVIIQGTQLSTATDAAGEFRLSGIPAGTHVVLVRRIGFRPQYLAATLAAGEAKDVTIILEPGAYELPEVEVTAREAKPIEYAYTHKYDDFFRRKQFGLGHYITRRDIERRQPWRTPNLLTGIPGVHVRFRHAGSTGTDVEFPGCDRVSVFIDGWKQHEVETTSVPSVGYGADPRSSGGSRHQERLQLLSAQLEQLLPVQIEAMEVYTGPASMPAEFIDDGCAAIVIWTR